MDPDREQLEASQRVGADGVELHTGPYAEAEHQEVRDRALSELSKCATTADNLNLHVAAGHGLDYRNVRGIASVPEIEELNIGHSIVSRSIFTGIERAVQDMVECIHRWSR